MYLFYKVQVAWAACVRNSEMSVRWSELPKAHIFIENKYGDFLNFIRIVSLYFGREMNGFKKVIAVPNPGIS